MEISQEKAKEFMQVSALVCLDLDVLYDISKDETMTADDLRAQIKLIYENKEAAINDAKGREDRYEAGCLVFSAVASGLVRSTPL